MKFDQLIKNFVKFLTVLFWILFVVLLILWFNQNKENFFQIRKIQEIHNPINPFE